MDRKGELSSYVILFSFFRMFVIIGVIFAIILIIRVFIVATVDVSQAEAEILSNNLMYKVSYEDPVTHRIYPRQVSIDQFVKSSLDMEFASKKLAIAAKVSLLDQDSGKLLTYNSTEVKPLFIDKGNYVHWVELAKAKAKGVGGAKEYTVRQDVLILETYKPAMIEISITVPNS